MYNDIVKVIQIESSTICNGKCKFCGRLNVSKSLLNKKISKRAIKNLLTDKLRDSIECISFIGNYGDPMYNLDVIKYTIDKIDKSALSISTNGSMHSSKIWKEFGKHISKNEKHTVSFCIDGISNATNTYRETDYDRVIRNMMSFMDGGGKAEIKFIVFRENEKYIDEVKDIAMKLGVRRVIFVNSWKYDNKFQKPNFIENITCGGSVKSHCRFKDSNEIFVDVGGYVVSCSYMGSSDLYKFKENNLNYYTLDQIFESPLFKFMIRRSDKKSCRSLCS